MGNIPVECSAIAKKVAALTSSVKLLSAQLAGADFMQKEYLAGEMKSLNKELNVAHANLTQCIKDHQPKPLPDPCPNILLKEATLLKQRYSIYQKWPGAHTVEERKQLASETKAINAQLDQVHAEYVRCRVAHGAKANVSIPFSGAATLTIHDPDTPKPFVQDVTFIVDFLQWDHTSLQISNFPAIIVGPYDAGGISNTTTITLKSGGAGTYDPNSGYLSVQFVLHFHESVAVAYDDDASFFLDTVMPFGANLDTSTRSIALYGTGQFMGGFLSPDLGELRIHGTFAQLP